MNKKDLAIKQLVDKSIEIGRTPLKSDFSSEDACFIKQKLGPWPRALEEAGLKEVYDLNIKKKIIVFNLFFFFVGLTFPRLLCELRLALFKSLCKLIILLKKLKYQI